MSRPQRCSAAFHSQSPAQTSPGSPSTSFSTLPCLCVRRGPSTGREHLSGPAWHLPPGRPCVAVAGSCLGPGEASWLAWRLGRPAGGTTLLAVLQKPGRWADRGLVPQPPGPSVCKQEPGERGLVQLEMGGPPPTGHAVIRSVHKHLSCLPCLGHRAWLWPTRPQLGVGGPAVFTGRWAPGASGASSAGEAPTPGWVLPAVRPRASFLPRFPRLHHRDLHVANLERH